MRKKRMDIKREGSGMKEKNRKKERQYSENMGRNIKDEGGVESVRIE